MSAAVNLPREQAAQLAQRVADESAARARLQLPWNVELGDTAAALASISVGAAAAYLLEGPLVARLLVSGLAGAAPLLML